MIFRTRRQDQSNKSQQSTWSPPSSKVKYPRWTFVVIPEQDKYYLIWDTTKLAFISQRAFRSWNRIPLRVSEESISGYKTWKRIGFAPGSIIESIVDGKRYFITGQLFQEEKRLITTPDFYQVLGFNPGLASKVSQAELDFHNEGSDIDDIRFI